MVVPAAPETPTHGHVHRWYRAVLVAGWFALALAALLAGHRQSTLDDLEQAIAAGRVDSVVVVGALDGGPAPSTGTGAPVPEPPVAGPAPPVGPGLQGPPPDLTGSVAETVSATQELRWRDGVVARVAQVEVRPYGGDEAVPQGRDVVRADLAADLPARHPGLRVEHSSAFSAGPQIAGWRLPAEAVVPVLAMVAATVGLLIGGPQPWRGTRWAWFWLLGSPWTVLAFLVLSGPAPLVPAPRDPRRRLTGGWAFLLALVLGVSTLPTGP